MRFKWSNIYAKLYLLDNINYKSINITSIILIIKEKIITQYYTAATQLQYNCNTATTQLQIQQNFNYYPIYSFKFYMLQFSKYTYLHFINHSDLEFNIIFSLFLPVFSYFLIYYIFSFIIFLQLLSIFFVLSL